MKISATVNIAPTINAITKAKSAKLKAYIRELRAVARTATIVYSF